MIQLGYILLTLIMVCLLLFAYHHGLTKIEVDSASKRKKIIFAIGGFVLWFGYLIIISNSGVLKVFDMPPRFPLLLVAPVFIFIGIIIVRLKNSTLLNAIPTSWTVWYQSFRIGIESLFVATVGIGILHPEVTLEGYNYDILFGVSALIMGVLVYVSKALNERWILYWNYLGLLVIAWIIFLFTTTVYFPGVWGQTEPMINPEFLNFPYILVPSFLMPSAVFVHLFSILKLRSIEKT